MEKINNVVNFEQLNNINEDEDNFNDFVEKVKGNIHKAAYFVRLKDGGYLFGCTEENKIGQERLLYHLRNIIQFYIENYPDKEQIQETIDLVYPKNKEGIDLLEDLDEEDDVYDFYDEDEEDE